MTRSKEAEAARERWTPFPATIYDWDPWIDMRSVERDLWWALVASRHASCWPPGLWLGSVALMSDSARMGAEDVEIALARLRAKGLLEYDARLTVGRLTQLPPTDTWRPHAPNAIFGWWTGFRRLPACAIRDSHVPTLKALVTRPTPKHVANWDATFGRLAEVTRLPTGNRSSNGSGNGSPSSDFEDKGTVPGTVFGDRRSEISRSGSEIRIPSAPLPRDLVTGGPGRIVAGPGGEFVYEATPLARGALERFGPRAATPSGESNDARRFK